jgi:signal transduction histidine kinase
MSFDERPRAFGLRLGLWYATVFVLGATAIVFLTYGLTARSLRERDRQMLQAAAGEYAAVYRRSGLRGLTETVRAEQATVPQRLFVRVVDRGAEAFVLSSPQGWDPDDLETASLQLPDGTLVQVGKSTEERMDLLSRFRAALGLVTLFIVATALAGGWLVTQSAIAPIRRLTAAVRRTVQTGRTDERLPVPRYEDAITELTVLFNAMLDRIEGLVTGMRVALDHVAHDLRTPLTRLRGSAEMALAAPPDLDHYRESLADCVEETDRVLAMLNTLMDISEAESGAMPLLREQIRLSEVASRAVELYRDVAESKGVILTLEAVDGGIVAGDRLRLEQVAANLIDNALKYTARGGRVDVRVRRIGERMALQVADSGAGIAPDEVPRIWERLFRGDASRGERGAGLGLSLVKAIVEAHGGKVEVDSLPGRGSTFTVSFPASFPSAPSAS